MVFAIEKGNWMLKHKLWLIVIVGVGWSDVWGESEEEENERKGRDRRKEREEKGGRWKEEIYVKTNGDRFKSQD